MGTHRVLVGISNLEFRNSALLARYEISLNMAKSSGIPVSVCCSLVELRRLKTTVFKQFLRLHINPVISYTANIATIAICYIANRVRYLYVIFQRIHSYVILPLSL